MATMTSKPAALVFDGRGYVIRDITVIHKPKTSSTAVINVYGSGASGMKVTLASAKSLIPDSPSYTEGDWITTVIELTHTPVNSIWFTIDNVETLLDIADVQVTLGIPVGIDKNVGTT